MIKWIRSLLAGPTQRVEVGSDIVWVPDVADSIARFGGRYLSRVFTTGELRDSMSQSASAQHLSLAARFAAKEATMKILQPTGSDALPWQAIEVKRSSRGAPQLALHGRAAALARTAGITQLSLSLSHDRDYATAVVVGLRTTAPANSERNSFS